jgi:hypothetical protein
MEVVNVETRAALPAPSVVLQQMVAELESQTALYTRTLAEHPEQFREVESALTHFVTVQAGILIASILAFASRREEFVRHCDATVDKEGYRRPERRVKLIRLLCGLLFQVVTLYVAPQPTSVKNKNVPEIRRGLYPELDVLGFAKNSSPALEEKVARAVALYPSIELAQRELAASGLDLDIKEIRRIAMQCGESILTLRLSMLQEYSAGVLESTDQLAGKKVVVSVDGGRTRLRENKPTEAGKHPKFNAEWREPKLFIIYTVNENGEKTKDSEVWIDGTFQGPDHTAQLLAMQLFRLGVGKAASVTFVADGAVWIWDRFDWLVKELSLPKEKVFFVLDFWHASHHLSLALGELGLSDEERQRIYQELREQLKAGCWQEVVERLRQLGLDRSKEQGLNQIFEESSVFSRELRFFEKHGKANRLSYSEFRRQGLPCGSGAMESTVRRVVNLRMKSNGTFWTKENAEKMLQLRGQLLSEQWEKTLNDLYKMRLKNRGRFWQWNAPDLTGEKMNAEKNKENPLDL